MDHHTYSNFVRSENDLTGLIAYSLYKGDKIQFKEENPEPALLDGFIRAVNLGNQIEAYRGRAEALLEEMTEAVSDEMAERMKSEFDARIKKFEDSLGFLRSVWSNTLATFLSAAILVALALFIYGSKIGLPTVIGDAVGWTVKPKPESESDK